MLVSAGGGRRGLWLDATEQARLIRQRVLSSRELVLAAIERVEAVDPLLNAVIHTRFGQALDEAAQVPGAPPREGRSGRTGRLTEFRFS